MMENAMNWSVDISTDFVVIFGAANLIILSLLLNIYMKGHKEMKSKFTMGLVIFAFLLMLQNVAAIIFLFNLEQMHSHGMGVPLLLPTVFQTVALVVLLVITWE